MRSHIEFIFGIIILVLMAAVLWKFIEPEPVVEVIDQSPAAPIAAEEVVPGGSNEGVIPTPNEQTIPEHVQPAPLPSETDPGEAVACTMDAKQCPDGSYVGRVGPNCEFASCPQQVDVQTVVTCTPESRGADACVAVIEPVCGLLQVECVTTPCNPVPQTFGNSCEACRNDRVISYTEGECRN